MKYLYIIGLIFISGCATYHDDYYSSVPNTGYGWNHRYYPPTPVYQYNPPIIHYDHHSRYEYEHHRHHTPHEPHHNHHRRDRD